MVFCVSYENDLFLHRYPWLRILRLQGMCSLGMYGQRKTTNFCLSNIFVTVQSQANFHTKVWIMLAWMNTFTWKSIRRIRHTDEIRSILEVVLNSYIFFLNSSLFYFSDGSIFTRSKTNFIVSLLWKVWNYSSVFLYFLQFYLCVLHKIHLFYPCFIGCFWCIYFCICKIKKLSY